VDRSSIQKSVSPDVDDDTSQEVVAGPAGQPSADGGREADRRPAPAAERRPPHADPDESDVSAGISDPAVPAASFAARRFTFG
jgi:hypothetical protein